MRAFYRVAPLELALIYLPNTTNMPRQTSLSKLRCARQLFER